ncbi:hypothetical protein PROFUN_12163 [Planoprotostelium fungivorum]|uniref:VWFA domain-containing protein n=1 Tax=Planoprotostelium fungivorum TaxID=1890364 RepID=A0A2P6N8E7_9EUKA|nr:hypothetical protein PROFUN_12163 [Planoprotostelium fungivorum]
MAFVLVVLAAHCHNNLASAAVCMSRGRPGVEDEFIFSLILNMKLLLFTLLLLRSSVGQTTTEFTAKFAYTDTPNSTPLTGRISWSSTLSRQRFEFDGSNVISITDQSNTQSGRPANILYQSCSLGCQTSAYTTPLYLFAVTDKFTSTDGSTYVYQGPIPQNSTYVTSLSVSGSFVTSAKLNTGGLFVFSNTSSGVDSSSLSAFTNWACPNVTCNQAADVILAFDISGSIDNVLWNNIASFTNQFASFVIQPNKSRMGLVTFGNYGYARSFQADGTTPGLLSNQSSLMTALNASRPRSGSIESSCIGCGISTALNMSILNRREAIPQILLILSDGQNNVPNVQRGCWSWSNSNCMGSGGRNDGSGINWLDELSQIHSLSSTLTVYGIGVGNSPMNITFMTQMSSPGDFLNIGNYNDLAHSVQTIVTSTCPATSDFLSLGSCSPSQSSFSTTSSYSTSSTSTTSPSSAASTVSSSTITIPSSSVISTSSSLQIKLGTQPEISKIGLPEQDQIDDVSEDCTISEREEVQWKDAYERVFIAFSTISPPAQVANWTCEFCNKTRWPDAPQVNVTHLFNGVNGNVFGFAGFTSDYIVFAFRPLENVYNLAESLLYAQAVPFDLNVPDALVHGGFLSAYQTIRPSIHAAIKKLREEHPKLPLNLIGYSFGAPQATLTAADVILNNMIDLKDLYLWTYGSPRVGNINFSRWMRQNLIHTVRVTNGRDPIPHLPFLSMGYQHIDREYWIPDTHNASWVHCPFTEDWSCSDSVWWYQLIDHMTYMGVL